MNKIKRKRKRKRQKKSHKCKAIVETQTSRLDLQALRSSPRSGTLSQQSATGVIQEIQDLLEKNREQDRGQTKVETPSSRIKMRACRSVFLNGSITEELVAGVVEELRDLLRKNPEEPVFLCINTAGGDEAAAHGLRSYLKDFLKLEMLVTVLLSPADRASSIVFMSGNQRVMTKGQTLDITPSTAVGFYSGNGNSNGSHHPTHPLEVLSTVSGPISAEQALEAGIATDLL